MGWSANFGGNCNASLICPDCTRLRLVQLFGLLNCTAFFPNRTPTHMMVYTNNCLWHNSKVKFSLRNVCTANKRICFLPLPSNFLVGNCSSCMTVMGNSVQFRLNCSWLQFVHVNLMEELLNRLERLNRLRCLKVQF